MSFPGFSVTRQGPVRIGGGPRAADFNLHDFYGQPTVAPPGIVEVILTGDFVAEGVATREIADVYDPKDSSTWKGAFRTGAWPEGTRIYLILAPGAIITGAGGDGGEGWREITGVGPGPARAGGGGGGMGTPPGAAGPALAPATPGVIGTAEAGGVGGVQSITSTAQLLPLPGLPGNHALIIDDGVDLTLENYGIIRGSGGGGSGGVYDFAILPGLDGKRADDITFDPTFAGNMGAWACHTALVDTPTNPTPVFTKIVTPVYPNVFGWEYQRGEQTNEAPLFDILTAKP